jgi:hypothetical protein
MALIQDESVKESDHQTSIQGITLRWEDYVEKLVHLYGQLMIYKPSKDPDGPFLVRFTNSHC